jgi:hypothetical protein
MTVASIALGTAISTATDMTTGIIARLRTMNIARVSVLTRHVLGAVIETGLAVVIVTAFAFLLGFRPSAPGAARGARLARLDQAQADPSEIALSSARPCEG